MDDIVVSVSITSDNGYLLTGRYNDSSSFVIDGSAFILKTDSEGNQRWIKTLSNCTLYSVQQTLDGGFIAAGVKNENAWVVKLAGDGESVEYEDASEGSFSQIKKIAFMMFFHGFSVE
ncbi:hypothetical protein [Methanosarcina horonobensis]|uniref:hypothetical protein n=1 Tax=Methanosarcina horonobensis TaxID=418008 RepID=UPI000ACF176D|nr:hypothetical protein [Methanosarcina horonobensis]